jgi:pilus assembly protein FimV
LGLSLDPHNPLYSASHAQETPGLAAEGAAKNVPAATPEVAAQEPNLEAVPSTLELSQEFERDTIILPKEAESAAAEPEAAVPEVLDIGSDAMTLDFDLGAETIAPEFLTEPEPQVVNDEAYVDTVVSADSSNALDFDFGSDLPKVAETPAIEESLASDGLDFDLDVADSSQLEDAGAGDATPDFSPAGTLVLPAAADSEEVDVGLGTWVGGEVAPGEMIESPEVALPEVIQDQDSPRTQTVINELAGIDTLVGTNVLNFSDDAGDSKLADTVVNAGVVDTDSLEFDVKLTDSMFLGQPMGTPEFDIGSINLDLAAPPAASSFGEETLVHTAAPSLDEPLMEALPTDEAPVRNEQWEEVNTKLDLAKAYEEMGDLEGARELLQEVVGEGPVDLVEQARTILGRIGE